MGGEGGYKIATTNPIFIREYFEHPRASEVSVPMGEISGLLCIDVDSYKGTCAEWVRKHHLWLKDALIHTSRRGGAHYIFKFPQGHKFPATAADGVDIKGEGGYICWAGSKGYECQKNIPPPPVPSQLLNAIVSPSEDTSSNSKESPPQELDQLEQQIISASSIYPSLRSLSLSLSNYGIPFNDVIAYLKKIMGESVAANPSHARHKDWLNRLARIPTLVLTANRKVKSRTKLPLHNSSDNPISPLAPLPILSFADLETTPIEWVVPSIIPLQGTVGIAGASGVGKTRWITALAVCAANGYLSLMGFPNTTQEYPVLWIANEERTDDLKRRINAYATYHNLAHIKNISLIGRESGGIKIASAKSQQISLEHARLNQITDYINEHKCKLLILDPYVSLTIGISENNAESVSMLRDAFNFITQQTKCTIIFAHHTPKRESSKNPNWYSGLETAFRGSSDIFAQLDVAFTLAPWFPHPEEEDVFDQWKKDYRELNLSRFITLIPVKMREGILPKPIIYEICSQIISNQEKIGFCRLSDDNSALAALNQETTKNFGRFQVASNLANAFGVGIHKNATKIYNTIKHLPNVPSASFKENGSVRVRGGLEKFFQDFQEPIQVGPLQVHIEYFEDHKSWAVVVNRI